VKVEKRGDSCFISHNGLTLFFNKQPSGYQIRVQKREGEKWTLVGEMQVEKTAYLELLNVMKQLL
jgi:hypothetical protein